MAGPREGYGNRWRSSRPVRLLLRGGAQGVGRRRVTPPWVAGVTPAGCRRATPTQEGVPDTTRNSALPARHEAPTCPGGAVPHARGLLARPGWSWLLAAGWSWLLAAGWSWLLAEARARLELRGCSSAIEALTRPGWGWLARGGTAASRGQDALGGPVAAHVAVEHHHGTRLQACTRRTLPLSRPHARNRGHYRFANLVTMSRHH